MRGSYRGMEMGGGDSSEMRSLTEEGEKMYA